MILKNFKKKAQTQAISWAYFRHILSFQRAQLLAKMAEEETLSNAYDIVQEINFELYVIGESSLMIIYLLPQQFYFILSVPSLVFSTFQLLLNVLPRPPCPSLLVLFPPSLSSTLSPSCSALALSGASPCIFADLALTDLLVLLLLPWVLT